MLKRDFMQAEIAIIGGSGVYAIELLKRPKKVTVKTPYGISPEIVVGDLAGRKVAFVPRHGKGHTVAPHRINYRANIWALHKLGVTRVLATTASGTINPNIHPGELALLSQFIDFTKCRPLTFYEGGKQGVVHIDLTEPYCPELRRALSEAASGLKIKLHRKATYACMEGPRFETPAEIIALRRLGSDLVGMTNVPECVLARELEICYAAVGVVTNYAAGLSKETLSHAVVLKLMKKNIVHTRNILVNAIRMIPEDRKCQCAKALHGSRIKA